MSPRDGPDRLAAALGSVEAAGRGDNARGRNLVALFVLEQAMANDWLGYRPNRNPDGWIVLLLDLVGSHAELAPARLVRTTLAEFGDLLVRQGLPEVAEVTRSAAVASFARRTELTPAAANGLAGAMGLHELLWHLDFDLEASLVHRGERHTQGRVVRKKISRILDGAWAAVLEAHEARKGRICYWDVLAAVPPSFSRTFELIDAVLDRVDDSLAYAPFAVYWALATDAAKGGRVWDPPERYVEGVAYGREDFERATGRDLMGAPSKKRRFERSVSLAELGLSGTFPRTVAVIDRWLATHPNSELALDPGDGPGHGSEGWLAHVERCRDTIEGLRLEIHGRIDRRLRGEG